MDGFIRGLSRQSDKDRTCVKEIERGNAIRDGENEREGRKTVGRGGGGTGGSVRIPLARGQVWDSFGR